MAAAQSTLDWENEEIDKIISNMLEKCKLEAETNTLQVPLIDIKERIAYYTGISDLRINEIQNKSEQNMRPHTIDYNYHLQILKGVYQSYVCKELPTFEDLFEKFHKLIAAVQNYEQFTLDLTLWGFGYHTIFNDTKLLMEDPKITFQRYSYLKKIRQARAEGALIYYVSVRLIDKDGNFSSLWNQNKAPSETSSGEYKFFHAISNAGFTNGLFSYTATENDFYKWVVDILLGSLRGASVVVLENSPLNRTLKSKSISMYDTKQDMQKWLRNHNVPCSNAMNKSQLYTLIKKHVVVEEMSRMEHAIRAGGHEVLILPAYFEDLSPLEYIWRDIRRTVLPSKDIHDNILSFFDKMPQENYQLFENYIKSREIELFTLDEDMDKALDDFLLDLKDNETVNIKTEC